MIDVVIGLLGAAFLLNEARDKKTSSVPSERVGVVDNQSRFTASTDTWRPRWGMFTPINGFKPAMSGDAHKIYQFPTALGPDQVWTDEVGRRLTVKDKAGNARAKHQAEYEYKVAMERYGADATYTKYRKHILEAYE